MQLFGVSWTGVPSFPGPSGLSEATSQKDILTCRGRHDLVPSESGTQAFSYSGLLGVSQRMPTSRTT